MHIRGVVFALSAFLTFCCFAKRNRNEYGETEYMIRMINITECPGTYVQPHVYDVKLVKHNFQQLISLRINVSEDVVVSRIRFRLIRCQQYEYGCEDFQSWSFTNFCPVLKLSNVVSAHVVKSITPSTWLSTCPLIRKGIYTISNLTMDAKQILRVYSESHRYLWKTFAHAYWPNGKLIGCVYTSGSMLAYTKRVNE